MEELVKQWFALLEYSGSADFDQKIFKIKHDNIASLYKRMSYEQQGEYTHMISERLQK